jgi:peptidyl-prolyl cis-trans isomerase SurA
MTLAAGMAGVHAQPVTADYIVVVVNREAVTATELTQRLALVRANAARAGAALPPPAQLRQQVLDALIDERLLLGFARDSGVRVDDADLERALAAIAQQNSLAPAQLRERVEREGMDFGRFRAEVRDQILVERVRERELARRVRVADADIEAFLAEQRAGAAAAAELDIAQILIPVPEGADAATEAARRAQAEAALARVRGGEDFAAVARELSQDPNRERGGAIGLRPVARLPELFVQAVQGLRAGEVAPALLRSGAGFHVLRLVERREAGAFVVTQTRARHILLRPAAPGDTAAVQRQLAELRQAIVAGTRRFDATAREISQDGSAAQGGDLGWAAPGQFVPEFERAMNALPVGGLSEPVVSRFGVHLIQVVERRSAELDAREQRQMASEALRERRREQALRDWLAELRGLAFVELRE